MAVGAEICGGARPGQSAEAKQHRRHGAHAAGPSAARLRNRKLDAIKTEDVPAAEGKLQLTRRLAAALSAHRHLRGARVLCLDDGAPLSRAWVQGKMKRVSRRAGMSHDGIHILRHSFCSHLAMRAAPARAIQEFAGHADLTMTPRYMHLTPAALDAAIRLLEEPNGPTPNRLGSMQKLGDILETEGGPKVKLNG